MSKYIKLKGNVEGRDYLVRAEHIIYAVPHDGGTRLIFANDCYLDAKQSMEEIELLLNEALGG